jgi:hypothetical protein
MPAQFRTIDVATVEQREARNKPNRFGHVYGCAKARCFLKVVFRTTASYRYGNSQTSQTEKFYCEKHGRDWADKYNLDVPDISGIVVDEPPAVHNLLEENSNLRKEIGKLQGVIGRLQNEALAQKVLFDELRHRVLEALGYETPPVARDWLELRKGKK